MSEEIIKEIHKVGADTTAKYEEVTKSVESVKQSTETQIKTLTDQIETLEAQIKSAPTIITKDTNIIDPRFNKYHVHENKETLHKKWTLHLGDDYFTKVYNDNTDVTGARVQSDGLFHILREGNPGRMYAMQIAVGTSSFKIPSLTNINFALEANVNTSRTQQGALASTTVVIDNLVGSAQFSKPSLEDVPGLDALIVSSMIQGASNQEGADYISTLNSATITEVNSGVATDLPTTTAIFGKLADMVASISTAYRDNCMFLVSRRAYARITSSVNTTLNFNPVTGVYSVMGYPIAFSDHLQAGNSANHLPIYFGNFRRGTIFATRRDLMIERYYETAPGLVTYFGDLRSKSAIWDTSALVRMKISA